MAICRLCGTDGPLLASHIVPAFVYRWLKGTSAIGYIRLASAPNRRVQDGFVHHMLCQTCEQRLSTWEKEFNDRLFRPMTIGDAAPEPYGTWLWLFAASTCWRALAYYHEQGWIKNISGPRSVVVTNAIDRWSSAIRNAATDPACRDFALIQFGTTKKIRGMNPPRRTWRRSERGTVPSTIARRDIQATT